jgi:hypothetical protein
VSSLQSVILLLSVAYALIGALLLVVLVYARLRWPLKAVAVVVTSAFYVASFLGMRGLLGWASVDHLPASFKLLQARIVEPHSLEGDPGAIYLWVEELDDGNRAAAPPITAAARAVCSTPSVPTSPRTRSLRPPAAIPRAAAGSLPCRRPATR